MNDSQSGGEGAPSGVGRPLPARWRWWFHLLLIGAYPLVLGFVSLGRAATRVPALSHTTRGLLLTCALEITVFSLVFGVARLASRASRGDLLLTRRGAVWAVPLGVAYSLALRLALAVLALAILTILVASGLIRLQDLQHFAKVNRPDVEALVDVSALRQNPVYYWLTLTLVSFGVAGFREELCRSAFLAGMRALWPGRFGSRAGQIAGVAIAAIVFGLGHLAQGPLAVFAAGLLGLGLGVVMVLHQSIWPAVVAHGMFDATTFALLPLLADKLR